MFRFSVTEVGLLYVVLLTVTPPLTLAVMRFKNPGPPVSAPGSKKPDPAGEVPSPVMVTAVEAEPVGTDPDADAGLAGGGAISLTARTPYVFVPLQYSWIVHIVISSSGSTLVNE